VREKTKHTSRELLVRAKIALSKPESIEIVESHKWPSGAQKAARMFGYDEAKAYSIWALAALKRDYPEIYNKLQAITEWADNNRTASTGNAEKWEGE